MFVELLSALANSRYIPRLYPRLAWEYEPIEMNNTYPIFYYRARALYRPQS